MGNIAGLFNRNKDYHTWKIQNRETASNAVYSYVNLDGTGILLDLLRDENGQKKVRDMIAKEITSGYITGEDEEQIEEQRKLGRFRVMSRAIQRSVSALSLSRKLNVEVTANQIKPQCWKENKRGGVGETSFHLCFLKGTPEHLEIARIFLEVHPSMANDVYLGDEYLGEGGLHLAIAKGNLKAVQLLVENGADVNQRATGQFFQPEDVKHGKDRKQTNYEGYAYYGEYPLSFAACFQHTDIYDYLIEHGADPNNKDEFGNTVLHMAVIHNQSKIYRHAVKHPFQKAVESKNKAELTPLTLASKLGRPEIFQEMLELSSTRKWKYGNISCSQYPLEALDSIDSDGKTDWESALMTILDGETDEHAEMLEGPVMSQLLREKWKTYAKKRFRVRMSIAVIHLITITGAVYTRPDHDDLLNLSGSTNLKYAPDNTIYTLSCVLILICIPLRFTRSVDAEERLLIIAVPGTFCILLFFARGSTITGPFVVMVYRMLTRDMVRFGIVYIFFCVGFCLGFSLLYRDIEDQSISQIDFTEDKQFAIERFSTWYETVMTLFQMTFGEFQYEIFNEARSPEITKLIFTAFIILVPILLLNMLIAMMGNTYHNIRVKSEKEWRKQRAKIIIVLERSFSGAQLLANRDEYSDGCGSLVVIRSGKDTIENESKTTTDQDINRYRQHDYSKNKNRKTIREKPLVNNYWNENTYGINFSKNYMRWSLV
ncbi:transient receptor potential cation channel subfamily V member 6 isoform X2 [Patella vulgata]|uniref:transient receptor potential cation channel subfamily V member 6 isoform X2 n=1 Tax=Patella vulgata TaxID=6465 RepID=UPI00217FA4AE|nr:transient receptor potential cation channel subfamily V member 6 isoform X2 [Patella vulgata]